MQLIRGFMEYADERGIKSFPALGRTWHELLYGLKKDCGSCEPLPKVIGEFDWDGPYPKSRELLDLHSALRTLSPAIPPQYTRMALDPEAFRLIDLEHIGRFKRHQRFDEAVRIMYERAAKIDCFFVS